MERDRSENGVNMSPPLEWLERIVALSTITYTLLHFIWSMRSSAITNRVLYLMTSPTSRSHHLPEQHHPQHLTQHSTLSQHKHSRAHTYMSFVAICYVDVDH